MDHYGMEEIGSQNYDTELTGAAENLSFNIYFNKNGFVRISQSTPRDGPTLVDWWKKDRQYNIGWKFSSATVKNGNVNINKNLQIPITIQGNMIYGYMGSTQMTTVMYGARWNTAINISSTNVVQLTSSDSGVHRKS